MDQTDTPPPLKLPEEDIDFTALNHIAHLDPVHLPGYCSDSHSKHEARKRRLIFIGDIHGCYDELEHLLAKVEYNPSYDHIIALGDVINKGPKSNEVVDFLMKQGASCVRGNHEDEVLQAANVIFNSKRSPGKSEYHHDTQEPSILDPKAQKRRKKAQDLAQSFTRAQLRWLNSLPVILQVGEIERFGNIVACHGGLVPGIPLENQDPQAVMNMRIIDVAKNVPSKKHSAEGSVLWFNLWHDHEKSLPKHQKHTTVVYGHDKKKGVQIHRFTKGLDTGCVDGGRLTSWVVGFESDELVHVKSKQSDKG